MIQIQDKYGENVEVTNLAEAIKQADYFRNFAHTDKIFEKFTRSDKPIGMICMINL